MSIYALGDIRPRFGKGSWIAPNASIVGAVNAGDNVSIWYNVVIRGDNDPITIGDGSNIQDGTVLHTDDGVPLTVGSHVTIGHMAMLHGCTVGDGSLIGINAIILNKAVVGKNCLIGANTLIPEGKVIPDGSLVVGSPGRVIRQLTATELEHLKWNANDYVGNARRYARELRPLDLASVTAPD